MPEVIPIQEGWRASLYRDGGGSSIRVFEVSGIDVEIANTAAAEAFGLPRLSPPDPHNIYPNQFAYRRDVSLIIDAMTCLVSVEYQSINFSLGRLFSATELPARPELLPLIWTETTDGGITSYERVRTSTGDQGGFIARPITQRVYTVPTGGDFNQIVATIHANVGKLYQLGSSPARLPYVLTQSPVWKDSTGQTFAKYTFISKAALPGYPANTFAGQSLEIPPVPILAEITSSYGRTSNEVEFKVTPPEDLYDNGAPLPGLPT